jgi:hypothetical protein
MVKDRQHDQFISPCAKHQRERKPAKQEPSAIHRDPNGRFWIPYR